MGNRASSQTPKWYLIGSGILGLLAAALVLVVRYYEIQKASAEAVQASIAAERARAEAEQLQRKVKPSASEKPLSPEATTLPPKASPVEVKSAPEPPKTSPAAPAAEPKPDPVPAFQPRSSPTTSVAVGHGRVEVTARAVEENRVIITIVGRNFGNDLSPIQDWMGTTTDLFHRKFRALGLGTGAWRLVHEPSRSFTVRDGLATMELVWVR